MNDKCQTNQTPTGDTRQTRIQSQNTLTDSYQNAASAGKCSMDQKNHTLCSPEPDNSSVCCATSEIEKGTADKSQSVNKRTFLDELEALMRKKEWATKEDLEVLKDTLIRVQDYDHATLQAIKEEIRSIQMFTDSAEAFDIAKGISLIQRRAHATAVSKGWYDNGGPSFPEQIALMHSELSEALEAYRNEESCIFYKESCSGKPEGVVVELADVIIRICDTAEKLNMPLGNALLSKMAYNDTRSYRHGGKKL